MTSIFDKFDEEHRQKKEKSRAEIAALCEGLESALTDPAPAEGTLTRQADLLDRLLYAVMRHNLQRDKQNGYIAENSLIMALRIQKQCIDTVKAASAVAYMNAIAPINPLAEPKHEVRRLVPLPPPPPEHDEQTE